MANRVLFKSHKNRLSTFVRLVSRHELVVILNWHEFRTHTCSESVPISMKSRLVIVHFIVLLLFIVNIQTLCWVFYAHCTNKCLFYISTMHCQICTCDAALQTSTPPHGATLFNSISNDHFHSPFTDCSRLWSTFVAHTHTHMYIKSNRIHLGLLLLVSHSPQI